MKCNAAKSNAGLDGSLDSDDTHTHTADTEIHTKHKTENSLTRTQPLPGNDNCGFLGRDAPHSGYDVYIGRWIEWIQGDNICLTQPGTLL